LDSNFILNDVWNLEILFLSFSNSKFHSKERFFILSSRIKSFFFFLKLKI
jgi:hypothetical protein